MKFQVLDEAALKTNHWVGRGRHFRPTTAVDAARDGSEASAKGSFPSGTGITRSSNERRLSSGSACPVSASFSTHRVKQLDVRGRGCGRKGKAGNSVLAAYAQSSNRLKPAKNEVWEAGAQNKKGDGHQIQVR
jgi:hypothetical protein